MERSGIYFPADVRVGSKPEVGGYNREVRFTLESRLNSDVAACPNGANCGLMHSFYHTSAVRK